MIRKQIKQLILVFWTGLGFFRGEETLTDKGKQYSSKTKTHQPIHSIPLLPIISAVDASVADLQMYYNKKQHNCSKTVNKTVAKKGYYCGNIPCCQNT